MSSETETPQVSTTRDLERWLPLMAELTVNSRKIRNALRGAQEMGFVEEDLEACLRCGIYVTEADNAPLRRYWSDIKENNVTLRICSREEFRSVLLSIMIIRKEKRYRHGMLQLAVSAGAITNAEWESLTRQVKASELKPTLTANNA